MWRKEGNVVKFEDNSDKVLEELDQKIEHSLQSIGEIFLQSCVDKTNEIDSATGRPTVDTGRYRAGWGYITPTTGKMSGTPIVREDKHNKVAPEDDISNNRANANTVVIANNVPYSIYLEFGHGTQVGGAHAKWILKRAVEEKIPEAEKLIKQILGDEMSINISLQEPIKGE